MCPREKLTKPVTKPMGRKQPQIFFIIREGNKLLRRLYIFLEGLFHSGLVVWRWPIFQASWPSIMILSVSAILLWLSMTRTDTRLGSLHWTYTSFTVYFSFLCRKNRPTFRQELLALWTVRVPKLLGQEFNGYSRSISLLTWMCGNEVYPSGETANEKEE